jgi:hypothetical protein
MAMKTYEDCKPLVLEKAKSIRADIAHGRVSSAAFDGLLDVYITGLLNGFVEGSPHYIELRKKLTAAALGQI